MSREQLLRALRALSVETGSLVCMGCAYEQAECGIHGCAILRAAAGQIRTEEQGYDC